MFRNRPLNHKINRLMNEGQLLNLDNSVSIHHMNLQILATAMFRVYTGSATDVPDEVFPLKPPSL